MLIANPYKGKCYKGNKSMQYWWRSIQWVLSLFLCCLDNLMGPFIAIISGSSLVLVTGLKIGKEPLASEPSRNSGADIKNSCCIFRVPGISSTESATLTYFIDRDWSATQRNFLCLLIHVTELFREYSGEIW